MLQVEQHPGTRGIGCPIKLIQCDQKNIVFIESKLEESVGYSNLLRGNGGNLNTNCIKVAVYSRHN